MSNIITPDDKPKVNCVTLAAGIVSYVMNTPGFRETSNAAQIVTSCRQIAENHGKTLEILEMPRSLAPK